MGPVDWVIKSWADREAAKRQAQRMIAILIILDSYGVRECCENSIPIVTEAHKWLGDMEEGATIDELQDSFQQLIQEEYIIQPYPSYRPRITIAGKYFLASYKKYLQALESWETFCSGGMANIKAVDNNLTFGRFGILDSRCADYSNWG